MKLDEEPNENIFVLKRMSDRVKQELLVRIVADMLTTLIERDSDQRFIDLYNDLKPLLESRLRRRREGGFVS